jgi:hypothetical protein
MGLFGDPRILWFEERLASFAGLKVLELGPLEGGHTYMMTQRGAEVVAIEANVRAWLRCLIVKQAVPISGATFLLGDFNKYFKTNRRRFDFILASGVLYHMVDPIGLLERLAAASDALGLWTHYFDLNILALREDLRSRFGFEPRIAKTSRGRTVHFYDYSYLKAQESKGFCGGSGAGSIWMLREDILGVLEDEGFTCETGPEYRDHPNGPSFCVFARRPHAANA